MVCADREPMYQVSHAQMSRQRDGLSVMFISRAIIHCDVKCKTTLETTTLLWIKSLFERIHLIYLTAAGTLKMAIKLKGSYTVCSHSLASCSLSTI